MKKTKCPLLGMVFIISIFSSACPVKYAKGTKAVLKEELETYKSDFVRNVAMPAVAILKARVKGELIFRCSAFAIDREGNKYTYASNAHCVLKDKIENGNIQIFSTELELALYDENGYSMGYYPANLIGASLEENESDFAIVEAEIELLDISILKLSQNDPVLGQCAFTVGFPAVAIGRVFLGFIYRLEDEKDKEVVLKVRGVRDGHGLSGSPVFDCRTKEVIAIIASGSDEDHNILGAFPISVFKKSQKEIEAKWRKYLESVGI